MGKDPAMLWYWNDWHSGTILFSRFLKGCYIDILHAQFNNGRLSLEEIKTCLGSDFGPAWPTLQKKFKQDDKGLFFNERLELEKDKRQKYSESRRKNKEGKSTYDSTYVNHMKPHMENENRNENENEIKDRGTGGRIFDAEAEILKNQAWFEQVCMTRSKTLADGKDSLRTYHLHLVENDKYPKSRKSVFAGFEKWLINDKKFTNGFKNSTSGKLGTSEARIKKASEWGL